MPGKIVDREKDNVIHNSLTAQCRTPYAECIMRKRRIIIFDDGARTQSALKLFFDARGYETMVIIDPQFCPVYASKGETCCPRARLCSDVIIVDDGPRMNGIRLLTAQFYHGCLLAPHHKAIISRIVSGHLQDAVKAIGIKILQNPLDFSELEIWVGGCEKEMDLTKQLAVRRRAPRQVCAIAVQYRPGGKKAVHHACALNVSSCGVCIRTPQLLKLKEVIHLWSEEPRISEEAEVRWIKEAGDGTYLTGLTFCVH